MTIHVDNHQYKAIIPGEDKYAEIKARLKAIGYKGPITLEMLQMGAALLKYK